MVQITVRDVPSDVRDNLATRAALEGRSMQEYLRAQLIQLANSAPVEQVLANMRRRKRLEPVLVARDEVLEHLSADRAGEGGRNR